MDLGFKFHHVTGVTEKEGTILFYCFNQGYTLSGEQVILLPEHQLRLVLSAKEHISKVSSASARFNEFLYVMVNVEFNGV